MDTLEGISGHKKVILEGTVGSEGQDFQYPVINAAMLDIMKTLRLFYGKKIRITIEEFREDADGRDTTNLSRLD